MPLIYYIYILKIEKQNIKGKSRLQKKELRERKKLMDTLKNKASWRAGGQHPKSKEPTRLQVKDQDAEEWAAVFTSLGTQLKGWSRQKSDKVEEDSNTRFLILPTPRYIRVGKKESPKQGLLPLGEWDWCITFFRVAMQIPIPLSNPWPQQQWQRRISHPQHRHLV